LRGDGLVESPTIKADDTVDNGFVTEALKSL
jgi:hypothetical protein